MQFITVRNYQHLHEALFARELLAAEGVEAFVPDEHAAGLNWPTPIAAGGVRLQVRPDDADRAREILDSDRAEP